MRLVVRAVLVALPLPLFATSIRAQQNPDLAPYFIADRAAEVKLARSAAPAAISDAATILVLTKTGYVEAARGTNGFTCVVLRSFTSRVGDPAFWNPRVRAPHCFNPPGARSVLRENLQRTSWILAGVTPDSILARTKRAYASGELPSPAPGAMAYMLSPQQYLLDSNPRWMPHVMFFYDVAMGPATWGAAGPTAPIIDGSSSDHSSPVLTLLIPVPQWSDGTPAAHR
jgi:hypothetical protein